MSIHNASFCIYIDGGTDMSDQIFRKKSLDRIQSPENLNEYVRVTNPGVWMLLTAVIILLLGACVWGVFGHIETKMKVQTVVKDGVAACAVPEDVVKPGMELRIGDASCLVETVQDNGVLYLITATISLPDGTYNGEIITETIKPISFIIN